MHKFWFPKDGKKFRRHRFETSEKTFATYNEKVSIMSKQEWNRITVFNYWFLRTYKCMYLKNCTLRVLREIVACIVSINLFVEYL